MVYGKKTLSEQNILFNDMDPKESLYSFKSQFDIKPYSSRVGYMRLPIGKFDDPGIFLDAYMRNGNPAMKTLCLAGIKPELRADQEAMLRIIAFVPEAVRHSSVFEKGYTYEEQVEFAKKAMMQNPESYGFLPEEMQKDKDIVNAYAHAVCMSGAKDTYILDGQWLDRNEFAARSGYFVLNHSIEPSEQLPVYKFAVHPNCDLSQFYSVENYQRAHEELIKGRVYENNYFNEIDKYDPFPDFHQSAAYIQMANQYAAKNPELMEAFRLAEAKNIANHIQDFAKEIARYPYSDRSIMMAEAVAKAVPVLEKYKVMDNPEKLIDIIKETELKYNKELGEKVLARAEKYLNDPSTYQQDVTFRETEAQWIDREMERATTCPGMGISPELQSKWWERRDEDFELRLQTPADTTRAAGIIQRINQLEHFAHLAERHPEIQARNTDERQQNEIDSIDPGNGNR